MSEIKFKDSVEIESLEAFVPIIFLKQSVKGDFDMPDSIVINDEQMFDDDFIKLVSNINNAIKIWVKQGLIFPDKKELAKFLKLTILIKRVITRRYSKQKYVIDHVLIGSQMIFSPKLITYKDKYSIKNTNNDSLIRAFSVQIHGERVDLKKDKRIIDVISHLYGKINMLFYKVLTDEDCDNKQDKKKYKAQTVIKKVTDLFRHLDIKRISSDGTGKLARLFGTAITLLSYSLSYILSINTGNIKSKSLIYEGPFYRLRSNAIYNPNFTTPLPKWFVDKSGNFEDLQGVDLTSLNVISGFIEYLPQNKIDNNIMAWCSDWIFLSAENIPDYESITDDVDENL